MANCGSGSSSGSRSRTTYPTYTPSPEEQERQRRLSAAHSWNEQGNAAYGRKDWAEALRCYQSALQNSPDDAVIQRNLGHAQNQLGVDAYNKDDWETALNYFREAVKNDPANTILASNLKNAEEKHRAAEYRKQQEREEAKTAQQMRGTLGQLSSAIKTAPAASAPGLDFVGSSSGGSQGEMKIGQAASAPASGTNTSAGQQLKSAVQHGKTALALGEGGVSDLRKPFDTAGTAAGSLDKLAVDASHAGQQREKPVPAALASSPAYKQLRVQKQELEKKYQEADQKLQQIRQQQAAGTGDQAALAMEAVKVKSELSPLRSQIATVQIKMDDMSVSFEEEHPQAKASSPGKTATAKH